MGVIWSYSTWPQNTVVCEKGDIWKIASLPIPFQNHHNNMGPSEGCGRSDTKIMNQLLSDSAPYLFPCTIEYR